jgi:hypothetical protein
MASFQKKMTKDGKRNASFQIQSLILPVTLLLSALACIQEYSTNMAHAQMSAYVTIFLTSAFALGALVVQNAMKMGLAVEMKKHVTQTVANALMQIHCVEMAHVA